MKIRLVVHLEAAAGQESPFVWWAEADELPGFSAAADHLRELLARAEAAIPEVLRERDLDATDLQIRVELAAEEAAATYGDSPAPPVAHARQVALVA
jgi:predicted RNase H-like HicB family nuclease